MLIIAVSILIVALVARVAWLGRELEQTKALLGAERDRAATLAQRVLEADKAMKEAGAINARQQALLATQSQAIGALHARWEQREQEAAKARGAAMAAAAERRQADRARKQLPGLPPVAQYQQAINQAYADL